MVQLSSCPVKDRHEIITDAFDSRPGNAADIFAVVRNVLVSRRFAQLDVLMNRNALDHLKRKARILGFFFKLCNAFITPYLADRNVIYGRYDGMHARDLANLLQRYLVIVSVPSE